MVRFKRRYFVLEVNSKSPLKRKMKPYNLMVAVKDSVKNLYGEFGVAVVSQGLHLKYCNEDTGIYYLRVNRSASQMVRTALPLTKYINKTPASISCLFTAATMRHADLFVKDYHEKSLRKHKKVIKDEAEKIKNKRKYRV